MFFGILRTKINGVLQKLKVIGVWSNHDVEYLRGPASPRVFPVNGRLFFDFLTFFWLFMTFFDIFPQFLTHTLHWAIDCEHSWACWTSEVFYTVITWDTYHLFQFWKIWNRKKKLFPLPFYTYLHQNVIVLQSCSAVRTLMAKHKSPEAWILL